MQAIEDYYYGGKFNPIIIKDDKPIKAAFAKVGLLRRVEYIPDSPTFSDRRRNFDVAMVGNKRRFIFRTPIINLDDCLRCRNIYLGFELGRQKVDCYKCFSKKVIHFLMFCSNDEGLIKDIGWGVGNMALKLIEREGVL